MAGRYFMFQEGVELLFQDAKRNGIGTFFPKLQLRTRGPIMKPGLEDVLYDNWRAFFAVLTILFVLLNFWTIFSTWLTCFRDWRQRHAGREAQWAFVPVGSMTWKENGATLHSIITALASVELLAMVVMLFEVSRILVVHACIMHCRKNALFMKFCCCGDRDLHSYRPWLRLFHAVCHTVKVMSNFSLMKTLDMWNPQVLYDEAALEFASYNSKGCAFAVFLFTHFFLGLLGFIAFATKFSHCVDMLDGEKHSRAPFYEANQVMTLLGFANQIFGITQLWKVQERRLMLFLFGGPDSSMAKDEMSRQDAFLAEITRVICSEMFKHNTRGFRLHLKRMVALLGLSHTDIQSFVLDETKSSSCVFSLPPSQRPSLQSGGHPDVELAKH